MPSGETERPWVKTEYLCGCCGAVMLHAKHMDEGFRKTGAAVICVKCDLGAEPGSHALWRWVRGQNLGPPPGFGRGII